MVATPCSISANFLGQGGRSADRRGSTSGEEFFAYGRSSDRRDARARYRYIGVERDEETGLCMTGPRTYDPVVGRFHQGDPLRSNGSPYVYSRANPITRMDPGGYADQVPEAAMSPEALRLQAAQTPDVTPTTTSSLLEGPSQYAAPPNDPASGLNAYQSERFRDTQFENYTEGMGLDFLAGMVQGPDALAQTPAAQAGQVVGNFVPLGHGDRATFEDFASQPGLVTGALAAATIVGVPVSGRAVASEFELARYGDKAVGFENHHGVLDRWAAENIPGYASRAAGGPTMRLSPEGHAATKAVFRDWLMERTGKPVGGAVDWKSVGPREVQALTERMFDAAGVPAEARVAYYQAFNRYIYTGQW